MKKHLLFVCSANLDRSPTAEALFSRRPGIEARSCGTSPYATTPAGEELIDWADEIVCMEEHHREALRRDFPAAGGKTIVVLDVRDVYGRGEPELVQLLREKLGDWLEA